MSRKHYIETARIIADEVEAALALFASTDNQYSLGLAAGGGRSASIIACRLADQFKRDNPRFDRQRFYFACALDENGRVNWPEET